MPIYEYRCDDGHSFDVMQGVGDDPVQKCEVCGAPVHRVFTPIAIHFKGSGFHNTDYGTRKRSREMAEKKNSEAKSDSSDSKSSDGKSSDSKSGSDSKSKSETKAAASKD
jgi:putative FmdB family regulatory protein